MSMIDAVVMLQRAVAVKFASHGVYMLCFWPLLPANTWKVKDETLYVTRDGMHRLLYNIALAEALGIAETEFTQEDMERFKVSAYAVATSLLEKVWPVS